MNERDNDNTDIDQKDIIARVILKPCLTTATLRRIQKWFRLNGFDQSDPSCARNESATNCGAPPGVPPSEAKGSSSGTKQRGWHHGSLLQGIMAAALGGTTIVGAT